MITGRTRVNRASWLSDRSVQSADDLQSMRPDERHRGCRYADRLRSYHPTPEVAAGSKDPAGYDVFINATPLGMTPGGPLPVRVARSRHI
jgi:shikimate 5-dehydrogenase